MGQKKDKIVFEKKVSMSKDQLEEIVWFLNEHDFNDEYYDEDVIPLTVKEVLRKPKLLAYIGNILDYDPQIEDIRTHWNGDGWCDIREIRDQK